MARSVYWTVVAAGWALGLADCCRGADELLTPRQVADCATRFADALRAWSVVTESTAGIDLASPALVIRRGMVPGDVGSLVDRLVVAVNMRLGAKVRFVRRDSKDPAGLPDSKRFDYESRLLLTPANKEPDASSKLLQLVLELYEPAGPAPVFIVDYLFPRSEAFVRQTTHRNGLNSGDVGDETGPAKKRHPHPPKKSKHDKKKPKRVRVCELGRIYFVDKKTASRLAVLTEGSHRLADGRLEVQVTLVCRKGDREVEIRTSFYDADGHRVEKTPTIEQEFEEGRPRTVRVRSERAALRFVMEIEKD